MQAFREVYLEALKWKNRKAYKRLLSLPPEEQDELVDEVMEHAESDFTVMMGEMRAQKPLPSDPLELVQRLNQDAAVAKEVVFNDLVELAKLQDRNPPLEPDQRLPLGPSYPEVPEQRTTASPMKTSSERAGPRPKPAPISKPSRS